MCTPKSKGHSCRAHHCTPAPGTGLARRKRPINIDQTVTATEPKLLSLPAHLPSRRPLPATRPQVPWAVHRFLNAASGLTPGPPHFLLLLLRACSHCQAGPFALGPPPCPPQPTAHTTALNARSPSATSGLSCCTTGCWRSRGHRSGTARAWEVLGTCYRISAKSAPVEEILEE